MTVHLVHLWTQGHKFRLTLLFSTGVLEEVESSRWASPLVIVKRPHGGPIRVCGDFRRVNQVTVPSVQVIQS